MLIDKAKYKETLTDLWVEVFGDDRGYVELIFNESYSDCIICFAELEEDKAVSAFYLIKNSLRFEGVTYSGYYLYAAATLPSHRKRGLMTSLIKEAQGYCKDNGVDFVSLVPSEEGLYGYYAGIGFEKAMYRNSFDTKIFGSDKSDAEEYFKRRSQLNGNFINFDKTSFLYAVDCLAFAGAGFYRCNNELMLYLPDEDDIIESLTSDTVVVPTDKSTPYGMLYPINRELIREWRHTDIYMNIALD